VLEKVRTAASISANSWIWSRARWECFHRVDWASDQAKKLASDYEGGLCPVSEDNEVNMIVGQALIIRWSQGSKKGTMLLREPLKGPSPMVESSGGAGGI